MAGRLCGLDDLNGFSMKLISIGSAAKSRALVALFVAVLVTCAWKFPWTSENYAPCVNPAQLKMGDHIFYIPRPWKLGVSLVKPGDLRDLCHASAPVDINEWVAFMSPSLLLRNVPERGPASLSDLRLQVYKTDSKYQSMYEGVQKFLQLQKIKMSDLPQKYGFRVWNWQEWPPTRVGKEFLLSRNWDMPGRTTIYVANDRSLLSPEKEPAIFVCKPMLAGGVRYEDCRTRIWDGQVSFDADLIETRHISQDRFKELYRSLLKLRQSLITNTAETAFNDAH
jgi:hypothetical protein